MYRCNTTGGIAGEDVHQQLVSSNEGTTCAQSGNGTSLSDVQHPFTTDTRLTLDNNSMQVYERSPKSEPEPIWFTDISGKRYQDSGTPQDSSVGKIPNPASSNLPSLQPDSGFESGKNFAGKMDTFDCDGDDDADDTDGPPLAPASPEMENELGLGMVCSMSDTHRREMAEVQRSSDTQSYLPPRTSHRREMAEVQRSSGAQLYLPPKTSLDSCGNAVFGPSISMKNNNGTTRHDVKSSCDKTSGGNVRLDDSQKSHRVVPPVTTRERKDRTDRIQSFTSWSDMPEETYTSHSHSGPDTKDKSSRLGDRHQKQADDHLFSSWSYAPDAANFNTINADEDDFLERSPTHGGGTESSGAKSKLNLKDRLVATFSSTPKQKMSQSMTQSLIGPEEIRNVREPQHQGREPKHQGNDFHYVGLSKGQGGGKFFTIPLSANGIKLPDTYGQVDQSEKLKTKMMSVWNNMKYGWTVKSQTSFSDDKPLFLLGKCYHRKIDESESDRRKPSSVDQFKQDFISRIWFTYRREFPTLAGSNFTTDCGWGCMLRSGQMMLSQALVLHFLGRDWRWHAPQTFEQEAYHRQIVKWFGDLPSDHSPFSVHRLVRYGEKSLNKKPGDWYGPASVAHIMKDAIEQGCELNPLLGKICLYIAQDCTVYIQDVIDLCMSRPRSFSRSDTSLEGSYEDPSGNSEDAWRSVIILIPIRLGGETLNPIYVPCVQGLFALDSCLGIIGGRPKHSLYFVGWQGDKLIHLDPHYCQDVVNMKEREFPLYTYHCISPRKMSFSRMDPSCTVGFYCRTKEDFFNFVKTSKAIVAPPMQRSPYPMFIFVDGRMSEADKDEQVKREERYVRVRHLDEFGRIRSPSHSSEEFVFL